MCVCGRETKRAGSHEVSGLHSIRLFWLKWSSFRLLPGNCGGLYSSQIISRMAVLDVTPFSTLKSLIGCRWGLELFVVHGCHRNDSLPHAIIYISKKMLWKYKKGDFGTIKHFGTVSMTLVFILFYCCWYLLFAVRLTKYICDKRFEHKDCLNTLIHLCFYAWLLKPIPGTRWWFS